MDCLALLSDKDLQLLGMTHEHRQLVKDAIANMQMSSRLGILASTEILLRLSELILSAHQAFVCLPAGMNCNNICNEQKRRCSGRPSLQA